VVGGLRVLFQTETKHRESTILTGRGAWNCLPQPLCLELHSLSPLQLQKRLKTFLFAGLASTDAVWERCWLEWCYTIIWLRYITLIPSLFCFLGSDSVWRPSLLVTVLFVTDLGWERFWIKLLSYLPKYICFVSFLLCILPPGVCSLQRSDLWSHSDESHYRAYL